MAEAEKTGLSLEAWLMIGLVVSVAISTVVIAAVSAGKTTVFSPYQNDDEFQEQQLTLMRASLEDFNVKNTMSTPMLVNDWQNPHRTLLVIAAPEKPFDAAEAAAIHDFVTKRAGKVILASNSTNAQLVAEEFGVKYFDAPVRDDINTGRYYEVTNDDGLRVTPDTRKLWSVASVSRDISTMGDEKAVPCSPEDVNQERTENCRLPVLFHRPTAIQVLDEQGDTGRDVRVLAAASTSAEIDAGKGESNPTLGEGETGLIIRINYPGQTVLDQRSLELGGDIGEIKATGSIVFVSDHSVLANHLWDQDLAEETGKTQCDSDLYIQHGHMCWDTDSEGLNKGLGDTTWFGNELYFSALINDMMEFDNKELSTTISRSADAFNIVFDESRHVSTTLSMPFTEAMGAIVLLTSDGVLKWLIILNLFALLAIAIMVVPEKENWRHVFDLTRFRERPTKVDPSQYQLRTREAFLSKVRNFNDLTRDEFARKSPAEIMQMIREPRLVELVSSNRAYSNDELRELIPHIRRWGN
ncbi:MAG: hypothetical protein CMA86_04060 [Euryarchaeota archaeon]|nr:hypothetical protein [Euryarchaeota archaeon]